MKSFLYVVAVLALHIQCSLATNALGLSAIGESGAFRLVKSISALPTASIGTPISVLPFQNSAGVNKLLVVDSDNKFYITDDVNNQDLSDLTIGNAPAFLSGQLSAVGNDIYVADNGIAQIWSVHADGSQEGVAVPLPDNFTPLGLVANHQTGKLYAATAGGIYEIDPLSAETPKLISSVPDGFKWAGIGFSADYQMLYASTLSLEGHPELDSVYGFIINNGQVVEVSHSPDMPGAYGVLAGTGCLADYLFVLTNAGLAQIDFHGVDQIVASHADPQAVANGFLSYDPIDGSMLIPESDGVYKFFAPSCGGFASTPKLRAHALPVGHSCSISVDCSSNRCNAGTCAANGYLGACQQNSDCVDPQTNDGLFCQSASIHTIKEKHGKKHKYGDVDFDSRNRNTPVYGVCEINMCVSAWGGCDADATCTPTGDAQRVCACNAGYFGTGLDGKCVNPCTATPPPCDVSATCVPLSATLFRCDCAPPATFGPGTTAQPCIASPCAVDSSGKNACGNGVCTPTSYATPTEYDCQCLPGNFRQIPPLDGSDYTVAYPQCVADRCSVNNGDCARNALCTPTGMGTRTCACAPGFLPQGVVDPMSCTPASCISLSPGVFPLDDPHASVGTCVGKVSGERCNLGCVTGYKPMVAGRSYSSITAVCSVRNGASIYTFTNYDCVAEVGGGRGRDDKPGTINSRSPWYCGVSDNLPCVPTSPWVVSKDTVNRRLVLKWIALGTSTRGDVVSELTVHITPDGNSASGFSTPNLPSPMFATTVTIDNLQVGHSYVFRLVAVTQSGLATGLPLEITF